MDQGKTLLDELSKKRGGYIMRNKTIGVEIKCTKKFVKHWEKRGFKMVGKDLIRLIDDREPRTD